MSCIGRRHHLLPSLTHGGGVAVMHHCWKHQRQPRVVVFIEWKNRLAQALASSMEQNRLGYPGRYFMVLKCASE